MLIDHCLIFFLTIFKVSLRAFKLLIAILSTSSETPNSQIEWISLLKVVT